jgi:hypothetical protein
MKYKFNPLNHGFESLSNFPELCSYFPIMYNNWFIKIIDYVEDCNNDLTYWYVAISLPIGFDGDDRVKILSNIFVFNHDDKHQNKADIGYYGLISSDEYAKQLLIHLFGTIKNESIIRLGVDRYSDNLGVKMRTEFLEYYV